MKIPKNPRSESAQRYAVKYYKEFTWILLNLMVYARNGQNYTIAEFDLRDCYRKRKPLTGIMKSMRHAVQPSKKRKK